MTIKLRRGETFGGAQWHYPLAQPAVRFILFFGGGAKEEWEWGQPWKTFLVADVVTKSRHLYQQIEPTKQR